MRIDLLDLVLLASVASHVIAHIECRLIHDVDTVLVMQVVAESLSRPFVGQVPLNKGLVLELELDTMLFLELLFVPIHELKEVLLEAGREVKLLGHLIWNV